MKLFRCVNPRCDRGDFEAPEASCPGCGCGGGMVLEIVPVHYLVPAEGPIETALGNRMVACNPRMSRLPQAATVERLVVTCLKCKGGAIFREDERDRIDNHVPVVEAQIARAHGVGGIEQA